MQARAASVHQVLMGYYRLPASPGMPLEVVVNLLGLEARMQVMPTSEKCDPRRDLTGPVTTLTGSPDGSHQVSRPAPVTHLTGRPDGSRQVSRPAPVRLSHRDGERVSHQLSRREWVSCRLICCQFLGQSMRFTLSVCHMALQISLVTSIERKSMVISKAIGCLSLGIWRSHAAIYYSISESK